VKGGIRIEKAKRIIIAVTAFILMTAGGAMGTVIIDQALSGKEIEPCGLMESIEIISENEKCKQWFIVFELISAVLCTALVIARNDSYKSKKVKITDRISTPAPMGEGQHGTARFMTEKEKKKHHKSFVLDGGNPVIAKLTADGGRRGKAAVKYKKSMKKSRKREKCDTVKYGGLVGKIQDLAQTAVDIIFFPCRKVKKLLVEAKNAVVRPFYRLGEKAKKIKETFSRKRGKAKSEILKLLIGQRENTDLSENEAALEKTENKTSVIACTRGLPNKAGLVIDYKKLGDGRERITCLTEDVHTLICGATGSGKTRRMVIPTVCSLALAGESIVITDPKGEVYAYTGDYLRELGYEVCVLNFFDPAVSMSYNPLQPVIDAVNDGDTTLAASRTWDLTSFLVEKNDKSEPIWSNGEMSIIAAAVLCVVYDNKDKPQYQNLTNVYWFIANMCKEIAMRTGEQFTEGENAGADKGKKILPITEYVKALPDTHPAKPLLGISSVAPEKTAGSFYTSALTTLRLYTAGNIYNIVKSSEFCLEGLGKKKQALFFILPDSKTTYYSIVSLLCSQTYDLLTESAKRNGNRLNNRVNFVLDEFGNFAKIPDFCTMLTVGRGYGIRYNLFVQSFSQLEEKYEKTGEMTVKNNCVWVYLASNDGQTHKDFETRLDKYTTSSYSLTSSEASGTSSGARSSNVNLIERSLLTSGEVGMIKEPWLLTSETGQYPMISRLPDLSKWKYNDILGLGDKNHNTAFIEYVQAKEHRRTDEEIQLWGIWNLFTQRGVNLTNLHQRIRDFLYGDTEFGFAEGGCNYGAPAESLKRNGNANRLDLEEKRKSFERIQDIAELKEQITVLRNEIKTLSKELSEEQSTNREKIGELSEEISYITDELRTALSVLNLREKQM